MKIYYPLIVFCLWVGIIGSEIHINAKAQNQQELQDVRAQMVVEVLLEKLRKDQISSDAAWEIFASLSVADQQDKLLAFVNIIGEEQKLRENQRGFTTYYPGVFLDDCSKTLNLSIESLCKNFTDHPDPKLIKSRKLVFDFRKLFLVLSRGKLDEIRHGKLADKPTPSE